MIETLYGVDRLDGPVAFFAALLIGLLFGFVGWTATCYWFLPMLRAFAELAEMWADVKEEL